MSNKSKGNLKIGSMRTFLKEVRPHMNKSTKNIILDVTEFELDMVIVGDSPITKFMIGLKQNELLNEIALRN